MKNPTQCRAFTLVELLVAIGIMAVLIGILLPTLSRAQSQARSVTCASNLRQLGLALTMYSTNNKGCIVPSFNMTTFDGLNDPLDGWGPILHRDRLITGSRENSGNVFVCPEMLDFPGTTDGQTGSDPGKPKGWMEWPAIRTSDGAGNLTGLAPITIPARGFDTILRIGYWINADNPIGGTSARPVTAVSHYTSTADQYYTSSVGYGPDAAGRRLLHSRANNFRKPSQLIALADGVYAGKHGSNQIYVKDSRIGYRHRGGNGGGKGGIKGFAANVAFADGHVELVPGDRFPRSKGAIAAYLPAGSAVPTLDQIRSENLGANPTIYANPELSLQ